MIPFHFMKAITRMEATWSRLPGRPAARLQEGKSAPWIAPQLPLHALCQLLSRPDI